MFFRGLRCGRGVFMTKLEAWKAWHESVGIGMDATEYSLEKSSHGKAFSYAWDAAVEAEKELIAQWVESWGNDLTIKEIVEGIRTNGNGATRPLKYVTREEPL